MLIVGEMVRNDTRLDESPLYSPCKDGCQYLDFTQIWDFTVDPIVGPLCNQIGFSASASVIQRCVLGKYLICHTIYLKRVSVAIISRGM